jgi:hypothetical protein
MAFGVEGARRVHQYVGIKPGVSVSDAAKLTITTVS